MTDLRRQEAGETGMEFLLTDIVHQNALWYPSSLGLAQGNTSLSWTEVSKRMERQVQALTNIGVEQGTRVAVLSYNSVDYAVLQYALAEMGAILVPLNYRLQAREIMEIVADCEPKYFFYAEELSAAAAGVVDQLWSASTSTSIRIPQLADQTGLWDWDQIEALGGGTPRAVVSVDRHWNEIVSILYTGGTTGKAKGVAISHRQHVVDALSASLAFGIRPRERFLVCGPFSHIAAWSYMRIYFVAGGGAVVMDRFDGGRGVELIERYQCNGIWGVPLMLREIIESSEFPRADLSSMRIIAYSSYDPSDLLTRVLDGFRERGAAGVSLAHGYGLTEGGPFATILRPEEAVSDPMSVGTPVPGVRIELLDPDGVPVPRGGVGEVCLRSAALMRGYWSNEEAGREALRGGWLHTGDEGRINEQGHLVIQGRLKDMIRTAGENVYAKEVENALIEHPAIADCGVIGLPDADYDERVVAVVVLEPGMSVSEDELRTFARSRIAGFKVPRTFIFASDLPKTAAGKTQKHELREFYGPARSGGS